MLPPFASVDHANASSLFRRGQQTVTIRRARSQRYAPSMRILVALLRLAAAAAIAAALVAQFTHSLTFQASVEPPAATLVNFFSYFTVQSNILSVVSLAIGAVVLLRGGSDGRAFGTFRVMVATYMTTTGVVYNTLLRGIPLPEGQIIPWSNEILHVMGPVLVLADWLLAPGRRRLDWTAIWAVVAFPLVWTVYTLIRGPIVGWYPYPFLNPDLAPTGYLSVAFYMVLIAAVIGGLGALLVLASRRMRPLPLR
jgi:hypothetical protein